MQKLEFKEVTNSTEVEPLSLCQLAPFTQAWFYGEWQEALGKKVKRFAIFADGSPILYMQLIPCPLAKGRIYYTCPYGPITSPHLEVGLLSKVLELLKCKLKSIMLKDRAVFTRLDFSPNLEVGLLSTNFTKAPWFTVHGANFQPRIEWWLPLGVSEVDILANMHQKTRYNIRLATKRGVTVEIIEENLLKYLEDFYAVQANTAKRNGFTLHEKDYYKAVLKSAKKNKNLHDREIGAFLAVAKYKGKVLTINFVINYGAIAMFVFGGSVSEHRNLMPSYLAHWEGAKHAKMLGMKYYNFGGYYDENGPKMKKKTLEKRKRFSVFKRKFGGREERHGDFYDCVGKPLWYTLYLVHKFLRHV